MQTHNGGDRVLFFQNQSYFCKDPSAAESFEKVQLYGIFDQPRCKFSNGKAKALFKSKSAEYTCGIFDKTEIVEYTDYFFLDISLGRKKIDQGTEFIFIQLNRQGVHGKISTKQIQAYRAHFHDGQGCRKFIVFKSCRGDIDFKAIGKDNNGGTEFFICMNSGTCSGCEFFCKCDAVTFNDDINIFIGAVQKKITDKPTDNIGGAINFICYLTDVSQ